MGRMGVVSSFGGVRGARWRHPVGASSGSRSVGWGGRRVGGVLAAVLLVFGLAAAPVTATASEAGGDRGAATAAGEDYRMVVDAVLDLWQPHFIQGAQLIRMSPDGRYAYVATYFHTMALVKVDLDSMTVAGTLGHDDDTGGIAARSIAIDPQGRYGYVDSGQTIDQIDLATMTITDRIDRPDEHPYLSNMGTGAMAPDGRTAYYTTPDGVFEVDLEEMAVGRYVETGAGMGGLFAQVLMAPDGEHLYHLGDQGVARVELSELEVTGFYDTGVIDHGWGVQYAALDPDGEYLFLAGDGHLARVAVGTMRQTHQRQFTTAGARHVVVEVDLNGEHVYVGHGFEGRIYRFDADRLGPLASLDLEVEHDEVSALAFGGDAGHLYAATFGGSVLERIDVWPPPAPVEFSDVPEGSVHAENIGKLVEAGITQGYDDGTFRPEQPVNRQQMASFLTRGLELQVPDTQIAFGDVSPENVHHDSIQALAAAEITVGCGDGNFCPGDSVTRGQMASFLTRGLDLEVPDEPVVFADVATGDVHHDSIQALAGAEITLGCGGGNFCPDDSVTRAQMASFLVRALEL